MNLRLSSLLFALIGLAATALAKPPRHHAHHSDTKASLHNGQEV